MVLDQNDYLWISLYRNGVVQFDGEKWIQYTVADGLAGDHVYAILADPNGDMWFACYAEEWSIVGKGLTRFDGANWTTFTVGDGLASDSMNDLAMDDDGTLWVAHRYNGVDKKTDTGWVNYTTADGLLSDRVASIYAQGNDIWIGYQGGYSFGSGASKFSGMNWTSHQNQLLYDAVVDFSTNSNGDLAALARNGMNEFDGVSWSGYGIPDIMDYYPNDEDFQANSFAFDENEWAWIAGNLGVFVFDGTDWYFYREDNIPVSKITSGKIAGNAAGDAIWIGSQNGVVKVEFVASPKQVFLPFIQK